MSGTDQADFNSAATKSSSPVTPLSAAPGWVNHARPTWSGSGALLIPVLPGSSSNLAGDSLATVFLLLVRRHKFKEKCPLCHGTVRRPQVLDLDFGIVDGA